MISVPRMETKTMQRAIIFPSWTYRCSPEKCQIDTDVRWARPRGGWRWTPRRERSGVGVVDSWFNMLLWVNFEAFWREKRLKYERQIGFEIKPYVMLLYNVNTLILCVCVCSCVLYLIWGGRFSLNRLKIFLLAVGVRSLSRVERSNYRIARDFDGHLFIVGVVTLFFFNFFRLCEFCLWMLFFNI